PSGAWRHRVNQHKPTGCCNFSPRLKSRRCCGSPGWSLEFAGARKQPAVMMKRFFSLGLAAIAVVAASAPAQAQSADLVLCDRLTANASDPDKPADVKSVSDVAPSDIATAIKWCAVAAKSSRGAIYQLGRAY